MLPDGWRDRLVTLDTPGTQPGRGLCLEPHDCVVSKMVAARPKDYDFAEALLAAGLVDAQTLAQRVELLPPPDSHGLHEHYKQRLREWVAGAIERYP